MKVLYRFTVPQFVTVVGENLRWEGGLGFEKSGAKENLCDAPFCRVVGSLQQLGGWTVEGAPLMAWHEGHKWVLETRLPKTDFEFKARVVQASLLSMCACTTAFVCGLQVIVVSSGHVRWEQEVNR